MFPFRSRRTTLSIRLADKVIFMVMGLLSFIVVYSNIGFTGLLSTDPLPFISTWFALITMIVSTILFIYSFIGLLVFTRYGQDADSPSNVVISAHDKFYTILLIVEAIVFVSFLFKQLNAPTGNALLAIYMLIPILIVTFISSLGFYTLRLIYKYTIRKA